MTEWTNSQCRDCARAPECDNRARDACFGTFPLGRLTRRGTSVQRDVATPYDRPASRADSTVAYARATQ